MDSQNIAKMVFRSQIYGSPRGYRQEAAGVELDWEAKRGKRNMILTSSLLLGLLLWVLLV